jgi:hypothetical protein
LIARLRKVPLDYRLQLMRIAAFLALLALCSSVFGDTLGEVYVRSDSCPFEGCRFGEWPVTHHSIVYSGPAKTSKQIGTLEAGQKVNVLTGNLYITPGVAEIVGKPYKTTRDLDPKSVVFILDYVGEGRRRVYQNGTFYITKIAASNKECEGNDDVYRCWVKVLKEPKVSWWVKVQVANGTGWVLVEGNLSPIDSLA